MKTRFTIRSLFTLSIISFSTILSQTNQFSLNAYKDFLSSHQNLTTKELTTMYDAGSFLGKISGGDGNVLYSDSMEIKFGLTSYEKELLNRNGFVVTERVSKPDIRQMFLDIWSKDLPVYISTDAILHAFHRSYDRILVSTEKSYIIPQLKIFLSSVHSQIQELINKYSSDTSLVTMLKDVDLYLTIPRRLMDASIQPFYPENQSAVNEMLNSIDSYSAGSIPIFSNTPRQIDFSQFKPRGHYTESEELSNYFKAMIWLGRIEIYLIKPDSDDLDQPSFADIQRQIIDTYLICEMVEMSGAKPLYTEIEKVISSFVGEQDNATLDQVQSVYAAAQITSAIQLTDTLKVEEFQDTLITKPFSGQKILSQLLMSDPTSPDQIKPASAFLLFGQRFVVDSYVTGNVVYDKIIYNNVKIPRMLPSTLDVLFALGNSSAAQLLGKELDNYHYSSNLASLRYLIDSYGNDFWQSSIYNLWLNSLKSLNPPNDRTTLPEFMQTAAWWQQKINGQLASWAELRHDNLLYAKQSYTAMYSCSYPYGYVEPVPDFYGSMITLAQKSIEKFSGLALDLSGPIYYFENFVNIMDTLKSISEKELSNQEFTDSEKAFMKKVLSEEYICGTVLTGWYYRLWYLDTGLTSETKPNYITADYHTSPSDQTGEIVGWVKHAGTGPVNLMVLQADLPGVGKVAFAGPVCSYYELTTTNFKRLTDEEWLDTYLSQSARPDWTNIYLADAEGNSKGSGLQLITGISNGVTMANDIPSDNIIAQNYPNPFNPETIISFTIPSKFSTVDVSINIYNIQGKLIRKLFSGNVQPGTYLTKWNSRNDFGNIVSSGIYIYEIKAGNLMTAGKMNLLK